MAGTPNSCRIWHNILNKNQPEVHASKSNCFEPSSNQRCADFKLNKVVEQHPKAVKKILEPVSAVHSPTDPSVVGSSLEPESAVRFLTAPSVVRTSLEPDFPVRRLIDISAECSKCSNPNCYLKDRCCNLKEVERQHHPHNLCSSKCRPLSTSLHTKEYRKRDPPKPECKFSFCFKDGSMLGRVFPMKFRIRRDSNECCDCEKDLPLRETVTDANNLILLSNCCKVEVYPEKQLDNWHLVPVGMISGKQKFSKKVISEIEQPKVMEPLQVKAVKIIDPPVEVKKKKKKRKKKKGKKGKKENKGKKGKK